MGLFPDATEVGKKCKTPSPCVGRDRGHSPLHYIYDTTPTPTPNPTRIFSSAANEDAMEEEAERRKRKEVDGGGGEWAKAAKMIPAMPEMEEEAVAEVMRWLEEEAASATLPHSPSSPSYRQETSFVTINGNDESCGPSFSSSASTVMASVDTSGGGVAGVPYFVGCPFDRAAWPSASPLIRSLADRSAAAPVAGPGDGRGAAAEEEEEEEEMEWVAGSLGVGGDAEGGGEPSVVRE